MDRVKIQTFLFSLIVMTVTAVVHQSVQTFDQVAILHPHVSYGHFGVELNLTEFELHLRSMSKWVLHRAEHNSANNFQKSVLSRLHSNLVYDMDKLGGFSRLFSARQRLTKRDFSGLLSMGLSVLSLFTQYQMSSTMNEVKSRQNLFARQLISVTNTTAKNYKNAKLLRGAVDLMESDILTLRQINRLESLLLRIQSESQSLFAGLEALMSGRLSLLLVDEKEVAREFQSFKEACLEKDFAPLFADSMQVFQVPASYTYSAGIVQVVVDLPIVPVKFSDPFVLYRYRPVPVLLGKQLALVTADSDMIALSADYSRFINVDNAMLASCTKLGATYYGHFPSTVRISSAEDCLKDIFLGRKERLSFNCKINLLQGTFHLQRLNDTSFMSYSDKTISGTLKCEDSFSHPSFHGYEIHSVPAGCVLEVDTYVFVSAINPVISRNVIYSTIAHDFMNVSDNITIDAVHEALESFHQVDLKDLVAGGEKIAELDPWDLSSHLSLPWIICIVVSSLLVLLVVVLAILWCCRKQVASCLLPEARGLRDLHSNWSRLGQEMADLPVDCPPSPSLSVLQRRGSRRSVKFASLRKRLNEAGDFNEDKDFKSEAPSAPPRSDNLYELV